MRFVFFVLLVGCFSVQSFSQKTPSSAMKRLIAMPDELVFYSRELIKKGIEPSDEILKEKLFSMFDSLLTGESLIEAKQKVEDGFREGFVLANTGDFYWAFPLFPDIKPFKLKILNDSEAVAEYPYQILDTYVFDKDSVEKEIKSLAESFQIKQTDLKKIITESRQSGDFVYHLQADGSFQILLKKCSSGWKISDFKDILSVAKLTSEG